MDEITVILALEDTVVMQLSVQQTADEEQLSDP